MGARATVLFISSLAAVLAALAGCAAVEPAPTPEPSTMIWPSPPAPARIAFVRTVSRPSDLGISKSLLARLTDWVFGEREDVLVRPVAVVEAGGALFVADPGARGVHRFDPRGATYHLIVRDDGQTLPSPVGLAEGADGTVLVSDSQLGALFAIDPGARVARRLKLDGELRQPTGLAFDRSSGTLFVADTTQHAIRRFDLAGKSSGSIGRRGSADGEFNFPTHLWLTPDGDLLVSDSLNFRAQVFDAQGRFKRKWGKAGDGEGDSPRQKGIAVDRHGHVYATDGLLHALQIFDAQGQFLLSIGGLGNEPGEFRLPVGVSIGAGDTIHVADSYNRRVQTFRYVGGAP